MFLLVSLLIDGNETNALGNENSQSVKLIYLSCRYQSLYIVMENFVAFNLYSSTKI